jgi:hypothetical protein
MTGCPFGHLYNALLPEMDQKNDAAGIATPGSAEIP